MIARPRLATLSGLALAAWMLGSLPACDGGADPATPSTSAEDAPAARDADDAPPAEDAAGPDIGPVLAKVDGVPVGETEFRMVATRRPPVSPTQALDDEARKEILDDLIDQKVLYLEARRLGYDQDPRVQRQMVQHYLRRAVYSQVKPADFSQDDLRAYFEENREDFVIPEKVELRRVFLKGEPTRSSEEAEALARQAYEQLDGDIDAFARVARQSSEGPFRNRGGQVGLVSAQGRPGLPESLVEKAFTLSEGEISEPFATEGGWNVIGVAKRRPRIERTFEQMKGAVLRRLRGEKQRELYQETVARLREQAQVEVDEAALAEVEIQLAQGLDRFGAGTRLPRPPSMDAADEEADDESDGEDDPAEPEDGE